MFWLVVIVAVVIIFVWVDSSHRIKTLEKKITSLQHTITANRNDIQSLQQKLVRIDRRIHSKARTDSDHSLDTTATAEPPVLPFSTSAHSDIPTDTVDSVHDDSPSATIAATTVSAKHHTTHAQSNGQDFVSTSHTTADTILLSRQKEGLSDTVDTATVAKPYSSVAESDEQSIPIVTSLLESTKNWFFGGNLVVRVGAIVLLMGVVLLLRLLSDYFEMPIGIKLTAIGIISLAVAGLGLKLVKNRYAYGITLQGAGLSAAYLTAFFAYQVYFVLPSLPSFMVMGTLSFITIGLALRQNALPLALLAFSGAFLAPLLTSSDSGNVTILFGYYLLLNVAIAIIAHYRTWKVLNLFGAIVTFGLAYFWGLTGTLDTQIAEQRIALTIITALHWLLYLFIAIRYAQQIIAYNQTQTRLSNYPNALSNKRMRQLQPVLPIDTGLMFATPLLALGLFSVLLSTIDNGLTVASFVMAIVYLVAGSAFVRRNQQGQHTLIIEGMLALGFGFAAITIALAFDANWTACGWSIQGLALVWFGRRVLRGWTVVLGLVLQAFAIAQLLDLLQDYQVLPSNLALAVSALSWMAAMFILRTANSPLVYYPVTSSNRLGLSPPIAVQIATSKSNLEKSWAFDLVWHSAGFITFLTFCGAIWAFIASHYVVFDLFNVVGVDKLIISVFIILLFLIIYWVCERNYQWREVSLVSQTWLGLFYSTLLFVLPSWDSTAYKGYSSYLSWFIFLLSIIGGLTFAQLWIKRWQQDKPAASLHSTLWLMVIIILIAQFANYLLPDSNGVMTVLLPTSSLIAITYAVHTYKLTRPSWFNWHTALINSSYIFLPLLLVWMVVANIYQDGIVWGVVYIPILNLFDISMLAVLIYGLGIHRVKTSASRQLQLSQKSQNGVFKMFINTLGILSIWVLSSILVRTLYIYAGTPLWINGAWGNDKVQTGLTILWTLTALIATFMSSRNGRRFWWFVGIGLLGLVVVKLVLVDLSQTDAIWRVASFLGAGSLILVIGYLAPLPPDEDISDKIV